MKCGGSANTGITRGLEFLEVGNIRGFTVVITQYMRSPKPPHRLEY